MAELVTLTQDGPLGKVGTQVWVDDPAQAETPEGWTPPVDPKASKTKAAPPDQEIPASEAGNTPAA